MDRAIAKCGVLTRKEGMLRRSVSRWYVLTNQGGFFEAKDSAATFDSLKPCILFNGNAKVTMEKSVLASPDDASYVIKIGIKERKGPPTEFGASSDSEIMSWYKALQDVIGLVRATNGDETHGPPTSTTGGKLGDEGWYTEGAGRIALYTRLYQLQATKRGIVSLPARMKEKRAEINRSLEERNATLTSELEKRNKERDEEARAIKTENTSLAATVKEQMETNRCLEERNATLTAELEKRSEEPDACRMERGNTVLLSTTVKEQAETNRSLEERNAILAKKLQQRNKERDEEVRRIKRETASLTTEMMVAQVEISRCLEERSVTLTRELEKANKEWDEEVCRMERENASLKEKVETSRSLEERNAHLSTELGIRSIQRDEHASRISRLEAELDDTRASVGSLVSLPERSRAALGSLAGSLESVLEECVICCELLLSGIGTPSFGVASYSCGCSRSGHVRALHVNCIVSMSNLKCPLCSEEIVLIAPSLMTSTAVRSFTVRKI